MIFQKVDRVALKREDSHRNERKLSHGGFPTYTYFFYCKGCASEIKSQHHYLKKHTGNCTSCAQKGPPMITAYNQIKSNYKTRNIEVSLTYDEFIDIAKIPNCHYCDIKIVRTTKRGEKGYRGYFLDRMDNNVGYERNNLVPCCWNCNQAKGNRYTYSEFVEISELLKTKRTSQPEPDFRALFLSMNKFDE